MKFTFRISNDKVLATNQSTLSQFIISESGLQVGLEIAQSMKKNLFQILDHKRLYIALPHNGKMKTHYTFVVRTSQGIKVWSGKFLEIENNDLAFTTKEECDEYCMYLNHCKQEEEKPELDISEEDLDELCFLAQLIGFEVISIILDEIDNK